MDIMEFDLSEFVTDTIENAESYGISNSEDACIYVFSQGGAFNPECNLDTFLFFDEIHPTTAVHQRAGATLYQNLLEQGEEY
jgi:phospholipase/lecithinase/hemolysin